LRLSATSASGKVYRLRAAVFDAQGPQTVEIAGPLDPADPQATVTASLTPGAYQISLRAGWRMYLVPAVGDPVEVPALLTSPNPTPVEIASGQDAPVTFEFQVAGETVAPGTVTVGINANDADGGLPGDGSTWPDPSTVPVIIPENVRVTDEETRAALTEYSSATGTLRFARQTAVLDRLVPGDVLVSAPSVATC
jgi:hypothetical protein